LFMRLYCMSLTPACEVYLGNMGLYHHVSKRVVIPIGVTCWILAFLVMCWFFWFGPGAIGYHA